MNTFNNSSAAVTGGSLSRNQPYFNIAEGFDSEDFQSLDSPSRVATGSTAFFSVFQFSDDVFLTCADLDFSRLH